jgi:hypothetical protein
VKFGSTPVLFNKVQFTVVFGVKITEVATPLNKLLKFWLLRNKVRLVKENFRQQQSFLSGEHLVL